MGSLPARVIEQIIACHRSPRPSRANSQIAAQRLWPGTSPGLPRRSGSPGLSPLRVLRAIPMLAVTGHFSCRNRNSIHDARAGAGPAQRISFGRSRRHEDRKFVATAEPEEFISLRRTTAPARSPDPPPALRRPPGGKWSFPVRSRQVDRQLGPRTPGGVSASIRASSSWKRHRRL